MMQEVEAMHGEAALSHVDGKLAISADRENLQIQDQQIRRSLLNPPVEGRSHDGLNPAL
jgi:hypothetical protein